uniref:ankyrin repeat domain-containing protein n=1 Tax=Rhodococcus sp. H36-A4 TaxID=3004353 RepID=UPI003FA75A75
MAAGADTNAANGRGFTPLHFAAQGGSVESARRLLVHGARVDAADAYGESP